MPSPGGAAAPALDVRGLVRRYGTTVAVAGLDLCAEAGAVTAVLGPNGAGKTTTIECCAGLRRPHGGQVRVLGLDPVRDAAALRPRVGVALQDGGLPAAARPLALLHHLARLYARPRDVDELAGRLGLHASAATPVRRLSGGQRRRLTVAAALVGDPDLVFLDEPGAGLDVQARIAVEDLVLEVAAARAAVVLTTHDIDEAERLAHHVVVVDHGRAVTCRDAGAADRGGRARAPCASTRRRASTSTCCGARCRPGSR